MNQAEPEDGGHASDPPRHQVTFEEIVAEWIAEGTVPQWPDATAPTAPTAPTSDASPVPPSPEVPVSELAGSTQATDPAAEASPEIEEHYVPPEPPPMPKIGMTASIGLALLGFGVVLLAMPSILGHNADLGLPLGLVLLALGLGWLVLRCWPSRVSDDDGDDGAVL